MAQGGSAGSGEERCTGTWRVCGRLELVEGRAVIESQRVSHHDRRQPPDIIR